MHWSVFGIISAKYFDQNRFTVKQLWRKQKGNSFETQSTRTYTNK